MRGAAVACLGLLALICLACPANAKFSKALTEAKFSALEKWVTSHGGKVKAKIGLNEKGVRGLYTKEAIKQGDAILEIPSSVILNCGSSRGSFLTPSITVLSEKFSTHTRFKTYFDAIPELGEVINACNLDEKLWPLFESEYWTDFIHSWQNFLERSLTGEVNEELEVTIPEMLGNVTGKLTINQLKDACALSASRYVDSSVRSRLLMIPFFDMTNHDRDCENYLTDYTGDSITLIAGKDLAANDEVCFSYGATARDDYLFIHYGFLPDPETPPRLLTIDHHQFDPSVHHQYFTEEIFESTSAEAIDAEIKRLQEIQTQLDKYDSEAAAKKTRPKKGASPLSDMLLELQTRRRAAVKAELERVKAMRGKAEL